MTKNRTGDNQCVPAACEDPKLFNAGQGCKPCQDVVHGCTLCANAYSCRECKEGLVRSPPARCYHPATYYNPCYLNDEEGAVVDVRGTEDRYLVLDGCLHSINIVRLEELYGTVIRTYKIYDYGFIEKQNWPVGYVIGNLQFGTYQQKYYLIVNDKIRQFENNNTVIKYGFDMKLAKKFNSEMTSYGFGAPITEDKGVS